MPLRLIRNTNKNRGGITPAPELTELNTIPRTARLGLLLPSTNRGKTQETRSKQPRGGG